MATKIGDMQSIATGGWWITDGGGIDPPSGGTITATDLTGDPSIGLSVVIADTGATSTNTIYTANTASWTPVLSASRTGNGTETIALSVGTYAVWNVEDNGQGATISNVVFAAVSETSADANRTASRQRIRDRLAHAAYRVAYRRGVVVTITYKDATTVDVYATLDPASNTIGLRGGATDESRRVFYVPRQSGFEPTSAIASGATVTYASVTWPVESYDMDAEDETYSSIFVFNCGRNSSEVCYAD